ncbi:MAG: single-stranded DNA-binding protein [Firmicutes bacterium]|nr:single-stranded DNA-binding protein [Bacillota bacterium]
MIIPEAGLETNTVHLCGVIVETPVFSHQTYGESFYTFIIGVERNSGYEDKLNVMISERLLNVYKLSVGDTALVSGQIRTYNEQVDGKNKLNIVVFARDMELVGFDEGHFNQVYLEGFICKTPIGRVSPLGRRICDIMLAVNRMYNKSDYIPCIAWGRNAIFAEGLEVGNKISLTGRMQSREYRKRLDDGNVEQRVAFEVSILQLENCEEW